MYNFAPENYVCPICLGVVGLESDKTMMKQNDFVYHDKLVSVIVNSKFVPEGPGHLIVVPNEHFENLFETPKEVLERIILVAREFGKILKEVRKCDGLQLVQNNGPVSGQHAFHFHLHLFPKFAKPQTDKTEVWVTTPEERNVFSQPIKDYLKIHPVKPE
jgi:histidine triad (HIT) family protein